LVEGNQSHHIKLKEINLGI